MEETKRSVDCRLLLGLYAIVPLALAVMAVDIIALDGKLNRQFLPDKPGQWPLWTVLFGLPHIVASMLTLADKEYIEHYQQRLMLPLAVFAAISAAGQLGPQPVGGQLLFVFLAFYTIYHVLSQQFGLTLVMMGRPPSRLFKTWKWMAIFAGFAIYTVVFGQGVLGRIALGEWTLFELLGYATAALCAGVVVTAIVLTREARYRIGVWYLWGNVALILSAFLALEMSYAVFVILMPRVIHDLTAYAIYVTHDTNRNRDQPRNALYRATRFTGLPPAVLLPLASLSIAYAMTANRELVAVNILVIAVSFMHYYMEGFIWKGPTPHRSHLAFR